jgi:hypothetical protein
VPWDAVRPRIFASSIAFFFTLKQALFSDPHLQALDKAGFMSASEIFEGQASTTMLSADYGYFCDPSFKCGVLQSNQSQFSQDFQKLITKTNIAKIHQCFFLHCHVLCLCKHN